MPNSRLIKDASVPPPIASIHGVNRRCDHAFTRPDRVFLQHGVIAVGCFPAASSLTGLGLALAKESSHGAVCWPGRITEGDEPVRGGSHGHDPVARRVCIDT